MAQQQSVVSSDAIHPKRRLTQNYLILYLDTSLDRSNEDCHENLARLRIVVNDVNLFIQRDECIDFLTDIDDKKAFLLVESTIAQQVVPIIHDIPQLDSIYILCRNTSTLQEWSKAWVKVKGIHTEISSICKALQPATKQCDENAIAVSFLSLNEGTSSVNLNQLEPTFMYTQIFKEIILEMHYDKQSIKNFTTYCRVGDYGSPINITRFENEYQATSAIWWYTYPSFIYSLLNGALRLMEADTIIHMGFFIRDLHNQIEQLHQEQVSSYHGESFIVYRGQGLSTTDFEKLRKTKRGLMSFNNFLSTSKDQEVSLGYAMEALTNEDKIGVLFQISIDPSVSSSPFAAVEAVSYYQIEKEVLFSMHTVFRIGEIKQIADNNPLYQVELQLTSDDDPQLRTLTEHIRYETFGFTGWQRLGQLLLIIGQFYKAEELYDALLEQTFNERERAFYCNQLGLVKIHRGDYDTAIAYYEKAIKIREKTLPPNHLSLATCYNNIGGVYNKMRQYSKALSCYKKTLEIFENTVPSNHPDLASCYENIASVYRNMGEYSQAVSLLKKASEIQLKTLFPNHPSLATSYNNTGLLYRDMGEYSKAISFIEKALDIDKKTLPSNHPHLATSYNNIAGIYERIGEESNALSFYKKTLEIFKNTVPRDDPLLATYYNKIASIYSNMGEYSQALLFLGKVLDIKEKTSFPNHPSFTTTYKMFGLVYYKTEQYSQALSSFERALDIYQRLLPPNHPEIQDTLKSIEIIIKKL